jgi:hypothetical protein
LPSINWDDSRCNDTLAGQVTALTDKSLFHGVFNGHPEY